MTPHKLVMKPDTYDLHVVIPKELGRWLMDQANAEGVTLTKVVVRMISEAMIDSQQ